MATLNLRIENMSCGACVRRVAQTLNQLPDTRAEEVQIGAARVQTDAPASELLRALVEAGYPARVESPAV